MDNIRDERRLVTPDEGRDDEQRQSRQRDDRRSRQPDDRRSRQPDDRSSRQPDDRRRRQQEDRHSRQQDDRCGRSQSQERRSYRSCNYRASRSRSRCRRAEERPSRNRSRGTRRSCSHHRNSRRSVSDHRYYARVRGSRSRGRRSRSVNRLAVEYPRNTRSRSPRIRESRVGVGNQSHARVPIPRSLAVGPNAENNFANGSTGVDLLPAPVPEVQMREVVNSSNSNIIIENVSDSGPRGEPQEVADVFKEFIKIMKAENANSKPPVRYPVATSAVPEFDPSKSSQTIDMWLTKVNECAAIYNWSEPEVLHYALPKLSGVAQRWYQSLPSMKYTWEEWQIKLKAAFPSTENYGILLTEMLDLRAKFGYSLENYFYDKMILLHRCRLSGKDAVDCILLGIDDRSVRTGAEAAQFTDPDKLLVYLRSVKSIKRAERPFHKPSSAPDQALKSISYTETNKEGKFIKCYNCGEEGHPSFKCKQPPRKCETCFKLGHLSEHCFTKNSNNKPGPEEKPMK